jgi:hypothetical protein
LYPPTSAFRASVQATVVESTINNTLDLSVDTTPPSVMCTINLYLSARVLSAGLKCIHRLINTRKKMTITFDLIRGLCLGIEYFNEDKLSKEEIDELNADGIEIIGDDLGFAVIISLLFVRIVIAWDVEEE